MRPRTRYRHIAVRQRNQAGLSPRTSRETSTPVSAKIERPDPYLHAIQPVTAVEPARIEPATSWLQSIIMAPPFSPFWRTSGEEFANLAKVVSGIHRFGVREHLEKHLQLPGWMTSTPSPLVKVCYKGSKTRRIGRDRSAESIQEVLQTLDRGVG